MMSKGLKLPDELDFIRAGRLPQKTTNTSMDGKRCLITGATSGVGYQAAVRLARAGAEMLVIGRNEDKLRALCQELTAFSNQPAAYFVADLASLDQVRLVIRKILEQYPRIDVLINNAGVHMTTRQETEDGFEMAFAVNHLASFLITSLLLKRMIESAPARIIQVNSEGHRFNGLDLQDLHWKKRRYGGYRGYGSSKTAQLMTVWELDELLKGKGVSINAMHPGAVKSNIGTNNGRLYNLFSKYLIQPTLKNPVLSGEAIYYLAAAPEMEGISGRFFNLSNEEIPAPHARNRVVGKQIFELSKQFVKLDQGTCYEI